MLFIYLFILGNNSKRKVSLSSLYLKVYADEGSKSTHPGKEKQGSASPVLLLPILGASTAGEIRTEGFLKTNTVYALTIKSIFLNVGVQLLFDTDRDEAQFHNWQRFLEESKDISKCSINRLVQAKLTIHAKLKTTHDVKRSSDTSDVKKSGKNLPSRVKLFYSFQYIFCINTLYKLLCIILRTFQECLLIQIGID